MDSCKRGSQENWNEKEEGKEGGEEGRKGEGGQIKWMDGWMNKWKENKGDLCVLEGLF